MSDPYGYGGGNPRDRITAALMQIRNPPPGAIAPGGPVAAGGMQSAGAMAQPPVQPTGGMMPSGASSGTLPGMGPLQPGLPPPAQAAIGQGGGFPGGAPPPGMTGAAGMPPQASPLGIDPRVTQPY